MLVAATAACPEALPSGARAWLLKGLAAAPAAPAAAGLVPCCSFVATGNARRGLSVRLDLGTPPQQAAALGEALPGRPCAPLGLATLMLPAASCCSECSMIWCARSRSTWVCRRLGKRPARRHAGQPCWLAGRAAWAARGRCEQCSATQLLFFQRLLRRAAAHRTAPGPASRRPRSRALGGPPPAAPPPPAAARAAACGAAGGTAARRPSRAPRAPGCAAAAREQGEEVRRLRGSVRSVAQGARGAPSCANVVQTLPSSDGTSHSLQ